MENWGAASEVWGLGTASHLRNRCLLLTARGAWVGSGLQKISIVSE